MIDDDEQPVTPEMVMDPEWRRGYPQFYDDYPDSEKRAEIREWAFVCLADLGPTWIVIVSHNNRGPQCENPLHPQERRAILRGADLERVPIAGRLRHLGYVSQPPLLFCFECSRPYEHIRTLLYIPPHEDYPNGAVIDANGVRW
jgi:hypothetical protein